MQLETGQFHGTEISEIPTDYLEWALGHLAMGEDVKLAVTAEIARRTNEARVDGETPVQRLTEHVSEAITKIAAKHGL